MSQNDLTIANQGFASFRSDLNSALQALGSTNSGTSAPSTTFANQLFYDTTNNILKIRNEDNDAFISLFTLDQTNDLISGFSSPITITIADNSDNLTLISTDEDANSAPNVNLFRNSASPATNDFLANIKFNGRNNNSQDVQYGELEVYIADVTDGSEDGWLNFNVMTAGSNTSYLQIKGGTGVVFNEDSNDIDFRVESNGNANMLFVDGGNDKVGIGSNAPTTLLHLQGSEPDIFLRRTDLTNKAWRFNVQSSTGDLNIKSRNDDGSASSTSMIIGHDGSATIANGLTLTDGNLVVASGHGIDFSATGNISGTSSELLSDYEEGTWTPACQFYAGTPTIENAFYTKIGRQVVFSCKILLDGTSDGSNFRITGLPFTSLNSGSGVFGAFLSYSNSSAVAYSLIGANETQINNYDSNGSNISYNTAGADKEFRFVGMYITA